MWQGHAKAQGLLSRARSASHEQGLRWTKLVDVWGSWWHSRRPSDCKTIHLTNSQPVKKCERVVIVVVVPSLPCPGGTVSHKSMFSIPPAPNIQHRLSRLRRDGSHQRIEPALHLLHCYSSRDGCNSKSATQDSEECSCRASPYQLSHVSQLQEAGTHQRSKPAAGWGTRAGSKLQGVSLSTQPRQPGHPRSPSFPA